MTSSFAQIDPPSRLLMGAGPANVHPRILRAMATDVIGQMDPEMTAYMDETMALYREVFQTKNHWTLLINGSARSAIEAALVSLVSPGMKVLIPRIGRFGLLLTEIVHRCGGIPCTVDVEWGQVVDPVAIEAAIIEHKPGLVATVHGDTSTTTAQPLAEIGAICRRHNVLLYVDATATLGGMEFKTDAWNIDVATAGLQKCLGGPPGSAPITLSDRAVEAILRRRHDEAGIATGQPQGEGPVIQSNYFDLAMLMNYWSPARMNHHTEATSMLYASREAARIVVEEGVDARVARHTRAGRAMVAGLRAMGLRVYGDDATRMTNVTGVWVPEGVDNARVRELMRKDFEIEIVSSFGPLTGKIWRIGAMGVNAQKHKVLLTLSAFEAVLAGEGVQLLRGAGVDAARAAWDAA
ncbi:pyridoxal-phosphate-dependent aminotransferase family protein [Gluconobacter cerinus]|uniref:pyridoxal-phosphate-dependent aminotransferase family protein n=1 Tax=Gluconobacter cerinus TaxID=38307 RepID=UPI001B8B2200|nr:alanine--glyoxylate aminotransferase family protein [Gluconobacter cerinus]MBS1025568.1 alanine--glyoxylate aminotransferase family protein [Gluconobacter cerinus]MBS1044818.1 alanine--glyoxylate aminotransferase family protein [Gluconobacter cerinus]